MHEMIRWLEACRFKEDLSQRQMAKRLEITPTHYSLMVAGEREPGNKVRAAVRRVFPDAPADLFLPARVHNETTENVK